LQGLLHTDSSSASYTLFGNSNSNRDKTELYLKPGAIIKKRQICQAFQLNSAHDQFILPPLAAIVVWILGLDGLKNMQEQTRVKIYFLLVCGD